MNIRIFQINLGRDNKRIAFHGLDELERFQGSKKIDSSIYDCAFDGQVNCEGLEDVFQKFNIACPEGYKGRTLSVSDVVEITESDDLEPGFYFCDSIGFKKVEFDADEAKPCKDGMKTWKLMIRKAFSEMMVRYVTVPSKWDLYGVIGYLYSNSLEEIKRIDYKEIKGDLQEDWDATRDMLKDEFRKNQALKDVTLDLNGLLYATEGSGERPAEFSDAGTLINHLRYHPDFSVEVSIPDYEEGGWPSYQKIAVTGLADIGYSDKVIILDGKKVNLKSSKKFELFIFFLTFSIINYI